MPRPEEAHLRQHQICSDHQKAALEARNALLQFERVKRMVEESVAAGSFALHPAEILELHRVVLEGIYLFAGQFRTDPVYIQRGGAVDNTRHQPPPHVAVPGLVDDFCRYINGNFGRTAVHLAAYAMWRLNWIHPFMEGNGRTSRAISYLVLCARLGFWLPGTETIPQQIVDAHRRRYYDALGQADIHPNDLSAMEGLVEDLLAVQLLSVHRRATGQG